MTWTYSGDPSDSLLDQARFLAGLTDDTNQRVTNEEINWLLSENANDPYKVAAAAVRSIAATYAEKADKEIGDLAIRYSQQAKQFSELGDSLDKEQTKTAAFRVAPYSGGISKSDKTTERQDTSRTPPLAWIGIHDNPPVKYGTGSTST